MKQCFGYVRVSTVKQGEGVSLEAQREAILTFANRNELTVTKWFEEKQTAAKSGRPLFTQMLRELKQGKAQGLIAHKIDRSARNFADWAKIGELSDAGIDIHFAIENLDFRSRGGRLTADIQAVIASDYIRNLREETIKGIRGRLKQGLYPFAAPIGYLDMGGGKPKEIDTLRAPLVREIFTLYATGEYPIRHLVLEMKARGLQTKAGRALSKTGIEKTLNNSFYMGVIKIKKTGETFNGIHTPLISAALFEKVQGVKTGKYGKKSTRHNQLFRGMFRCAYCNGPMTPERQKGNVYYRCHTKLCETKTVREHVLDDATAEALSRLRFDKQQVATITKKIASWAKTPANHLEILNIKSQIDKQNKRLDSLTNKLIDEVIDDATFQKVKEQILLRTASLEQKWQGLVDLEANVEKLKSFLERAKNLYFQYIHANSDEKRRLVFLLTSNRVVSGRKVDVELQNWLDCLVLGSFDLYGAPARPTSRRSHPVGKSEVLDFDDIISHINHLNDANQE